MILILLIIVIVAILMVFKAKGNSTDMKTDAIEFDTLKTVQQITSALRSVKCQMERLNDDPLADVDGGPHPVIAVLMTGRASFSDAFKHYGAGRSEWGVQVIVYDLGNKRHVELIALGESAMGASWRAYAAGNSSMANQYFEIRHSKDYRDRIAQMIA